MAAVMDSAIIFVQWDEVPCLQQNSNITEYIIQYRPVSEGQPNSDQITVTDRMASLTGLQPFTNYSIEVAAVNSIGDNGPFSTPVTEHTPAASEFCCMLLYGYEVHCSPGGGAIIIRMERRSSCLMNNLYFNVVLFLCIRASTQVIYNLQAIGAYEITESNFSLYIFS